MAEAELEMRRHVRQGDATVRHPQEKASTSPRPSDCWTIEDIQEAHVARLNRLLASSS